MAMELVQKEYEKLQNSFDGRIVAGFQKPDGSIIYTFFPDVEALKMMSEKKEKYPKIAYVGQIKLQQTEEGLVPTLEDVDLSKVKHLRLPESFVEKAKERGEKRRKEREKNAQKLRSYSSQIPDEIKSMIRGIDDETSYAVMACLSKEGEQSYAQLKEKLGLDDRTLRNSIVKMEESALVNEKGPIYFIKDKTTERTIDVTASPQESTFEVTSLGKSLMRNLSKIYELPPKGE